MSNVTIIKSAILLAFGRNRIAITKKALKMIGNPKYILLLINPDERTLAVLCSNETERRAHCIRPSRQGPQLCSKILLRNIFALRGNWLIDYSYSVDGEIYPEEGMIKFKIDEAVLVSINKGIEKCR